MLGLFDDLHFQGFVALKLDSGGWEGANNMGPTPFANILQNSAIFETKHAFSWIRLAALVAFEIFFVFDVRGIAISMGKSFTVFAD